MKRLFLAMTVAALTVAMPSPAAAGDFGAFCDYNPANHRVTMELFGDFDPFVAISRDVAGHIYLDGAWCDGRPPSQTPTP